MWRERWRIRALLAAATVIPIVALSWLRVAFGVVLSVVALLAMQPDPAMLRQLYEEEVTRKKLEYGASDRAGYAAGPGHAPPALRGRSHTQEVGVRRLR